MFTNVTRQPHDQRDVHDEQVSCGRWTARTYDVTYDLRSAVARLHARARKPAGSSRSGTSGPAVTEATTLVDQGQSMRQSDGHPVPGLPFRFLDRDPGWCDHRSDGVPVAPRLIADVTTHRSQIRQERPANHPGHLESGQPSRRPAGHRIAPLGAEYRQRQSGTR